MRPGTDWKAQIRAWEWKQWNTRKQFAKAIADGENTDSLSRDLDLIEKHLQRLEHMKSLTR